MADQKSNKRKRYAPDVKKAFVAATTKARDEGKSWDQAYEVAKAAGYTGTRPGLEQLMRQTVGKKKATTKKSKQKKTTSRRKTAPRKKAASTKRAPTKLGSKSAFIRAQPADMPAKEVVKKAAAAGMKISEASVYGVRSTARKKTGAKKRLPASAPAATKAAVATKAPAAQDDAEIEFRRLLMRIGYDRARQLFAAAEQHIKTFVGEHG